MIFDTNIQGTVRVLDALRQYSPNAVVHVCVTEVFGRVLKEKIPRKPDFIRLPYAISKVGTDLIGRYYAEAYDMTVMTTRMFTYWPPA